MNLLGVDNVQSCSFENTVPVTSCRALKSKIFRTFSESVGKINYSMDGDQTVTYDYSYVPHQKKVMRVSNGKFEVNYLL